MTETTFLAEWSELKKSEADLIIFRVGIELIPPSRHQLDKFKEEIEKFFEDNHIDIPVLVLAKAVVEVEAINKYDIHPDDPRWKKSVKHSDMQPSVGGKVFEDDSED